MHVRIEPGSTIGEAIPRAVSKLVHELSAHEAAAKRGVVEEGIHDLRVATKRLREVTRVFAPALPRRERKKRLARLEALNDALGDVRDADVAVASLRRSRSRAAADVAHAIGRERARAQQRLVRALDRFEARHEPKKLRRLSRAAGRGAELGVDAHVEELASAVLIRRLDRLVESLGAARAIPDAAALHRLRIRVKKARYGFEPFLTLLPEKGDAVVAEMKSLQDELGAVHDADVLAAHVLRELGRAKPHARRGLAALLGAVEGRRRRTVVPLLAHFARLASDGLLPSVRAAVSSLSRANK